MNRRSYGGSRRTPRHSRHRDDTGGVWIATGIVLGLLLYALIVLMYVAGFSEVAPLVIIPPVLIGLIGANNLIGGGRHQGRPPGRVAPPPSPVPANGSHPNGSHTDSSGSTPPLGTPSPGEPPGPS
jgi:hypothetical protein